MEQFKMVGYVVERWQDEKDIQESKELYEKIKEEKGEQWNELVKQAPIFEEYLLGTIKPHWFGIKGGDRYSWAKLYKMEQERITGKKHRVVKAGFPSADTWTGYTVLDWN